MPRALRVVMRVAECGGVVDLVDREDGNVGHAAYPQTTTIREAEPIRGKRRHLADRLR